jgi:hypothetical protein
MIRDEKNQPTLLTSLSGLPDKFVALCSARAIVTADQAAVILSQLKTADPSDLARDGITETQLEEIKAILPQAALQRAAMASQWKTFVPGIPDVGDGPRPPDLEGDTIWNRMLTDLPDLLDVQQVPDSPADDNRNENGGKEK